MKNLLLLFILVICFTSCAIQAPILTHYFSQIGGNDDEYLRYSRLIDLSKVDLSEKGIAKNLIKSQCDFKKSIIRFNISNDSILKANTKKNSNYSIVSSWVGGLGGLSSAASLISSWAIVVPIVSGAWNLIGLSIQSINIKPEIDNANANKEEITAINEKFFGANEKFQIMIGANTREEANKCYENWRKDINSALKDASEAFGIFKK